MVAVCCITNGIEIEGRSHETAKTFGNGGMKKGKNIVGKKFNGEIPRRANEPPRFQQDGKPHIAKNLCLLAKAAFCQLQTLASLVCTIKNTL